MKVKHLVLGTLCLALCAGTGWAKPKILDESVLAWWRFDNGNYSVDSSGHGSTFNVNGFDCYASGGSTGGCIHSKNAGDTCTGALASGLSFNGTTTKPYYTVIARFKSETTVSTGKSEDAIINDPDHWHMLLIRYQGKMISNYNWTYVFDPEVELGGKWYWGNSDRCEETEPSIGSFICPLGVSGSSVTVGGKFGAGFSVTKLKSSFDEVMVINRVLTKWEMTRLYLTGETYIFPYVYSSAHPYFTKPGSVSFSTASGWSNVETTTSKSYEYAPGELKGAAYIVDNGLTLDSPAESTSLFGGSVGNKISLTLGRLENLVGKDGTVCTSNPIGNFVQKTGAETVGFYDLRLNNGTIRSESGNQTLNATLLDVDASGMAAFCVNVPNASQTYTFNITGSDGVTGSGVLAKTGAGKLVLNNFTAAAGECPKVRLAAGSIKTSRLDGYTGGTVIVDGDAVTFTGADTLSGTIQVRYDGTIAAAEATYPVLNAPTLTSADQVAIIAAIPEKYEGAPKLENGVVSLVVTKKVAPIPDEDKGAKPVLLWQ